MNLHRFAAAALATAALASRAFAGDEAFDEALRIEKKIRETCDKVVPAFVFIGGGSGVLISSDGWFLTNHHVAANPRNMVVDALDQSCNLAGGRFFKCEIVGLDPVGDICLGKIKDAKDLPYVEFGDSDAVRVGEPVIAVGNPFMLGSTDFNPTVTFGTVSANHVNANAGYTDVIQTDAAVNPGNSGGPLFSIDGKLLGINGRINTRFSNRVNTGIGYAIPANQIKRFMRDLKKGGYVRHALLEGLQGAQNWDDLHAESEGALVRSVTAKSTADKAGFRKDDVIVEVEGHKIHNYWRFLGILGAYPGGSEITVKVKRGAEVVDIVVKLDKQAKVAAAKKKADLGASFEDAEDGSGVRILSVRSKSDAKAKGLKKGDIVLKIGGKEVQDAESLKKAVLSYPAHKIAPVVIKRGDAELDLEIKLDPAE
ncbi:MAG: trypsin-like peptidase domain-containing protein [Planctomycetia bacterium]|nr:trypsin-like peptidase domain-containing protein [Planctomycetia bacterium]